ncbi:hypothetical protein KGM_206199 [Danaus plexippus plexippus]|uniref:Uncharacterized protein n=1 Tax=Danaus plexippus plexippus TaxID=278856 RepID=A0A212FCT9_DANPL|nr:hypothetical protein KGM_206199 [Danaus plexippus plexippus]
MDVLPDSDSASKDMNVASVISKRLRKRPREGADLGSYSVLTDIVVTAPRSVPKKEVESSSAISDIGVEAKELPDSDLNQRIPDAVAAMKRVSKVSKGLSGCSQEAFKKTTATILERAQELLTRITTEETGLLRAQNAKLAAQMLELPKEHEELKAEMTNFRREQPRRDVGLPHATMLLQLPSQPSKQQSSQETELIRLIHQEMASFIAVMIKWTFPNFHF